MNSADKQHALIKTIKHRWLTVVKRNSSNSSLGWISSKWFSTGADSTLETPLFLSGFFFTKIGFTFFKRFCKSINVQPLIYPQAHANVPHWFNNMHTSILTLFTTSFTSFSTVGISTGTSSGSSLNSTWTLLSFLTPLLLLLSEVKSSEPVVTSLSDVILTRLAAFSLFS